MIDLRLGRWEDVLADAGEVDAVICDPPYSARTHEGHDDGAQVANLLTRSGAHRKKSDGCLNTYKPRRTIDESTKARTSDGSQCVYCDPCAGAATTLIAAVAEGRRAVGSEVDPETHAVAAKRIAEGITGTFDFGGAA